jgi:PIN domain
LRLLDGTGNGALRVEQFTRPDSVHCRALLLKYRDLDLGLADASVIAVAERLGVRWILTVDERDFRAVRSADGEAFVVVPRDERARAAIGCEKRYLSALSRVSGFPEKPAPPDGSGAGWRWN